MSPVCPKNAQHRARRVYVQVTSPMTKRSTTVALPYVYCGGVETKTVTTAAGKRVVGVLVAEQGQHGLVALDAASFATAQRQSTALAARRHPDWVGVPEPKPEKPKAPVKPSAKAPPKTKKGAPSPRKPRKASEPAPKPKTRRKAAPAAPIAASDSVAEVAVKVAKATLDAVTAPSTTQPTSPAEAIQAAADANAAFEAAAAKRQKGGAPSA